MFEDDEQESRDTGLSRGSNIGKDGLTKHSAVKAAIFVALLLVCVVVIYMLIIGPAGDNADNNNQSGTNNGQNDTGTNGPGNGGEDNGPGTPGNGETTPPPTPTPNPNFPLRQGDEDKEEIKELQGLLIEKGYLDLSMDDRTERFGPATYDAVRTFQEENFIPVDGVVSQELFERISNAETRISIGVGESDPIVKELQGLLIERGYLDLSMDDRTERFGPATQAAVRTFQEENGLPLRPRITNALIERVEAADPRGED